MHDFCQGFLMAMKRDCDARVLSLVAYRNEAGQIMTVLCVAPQATVCLC